MLFKCFKTPKVGTTVYPSKARKGLISGIVLDLADLKAWQETVNANTLNKLTGEYHTRVFPLVADKCSISWGYTTPENKELVRHTLNLMILKKEIDPTKEVPILWKKEKGFISWEKVENLYHKRTKKMTCKTCKHWLAKEHMSENVRSRKYYQGACVHPTNFFRSILLDKDTGSCGRHEQKTCNQNQKEKTS